MSNIDKQSLREAANAANGASWGNWESYKPHKGARGYEVKVGAKAVAQHCLKVDSVFIAAANPETVLALLDELEAAQKVSAARLGAIDTTHKMFQRERDRAEKAEKRIAELEAREVTLPAQKCCPAEYAGSVLWSETEVWNQAIYECAKAIRSAGIGKGE
ncbi:ead/Ea22-like family protein [Enterobacter hormaechei]|uniref:ead/Ea22-like family protein n=1 Tax=Enterobacter hormaechei TaxID=158836 RepID=UPI0022AD0F64|nr:ead/Ea22-like family protein [Enterobacter hormaechei]